MTKFKKKVYRERPQLKSRKKLGRLEKHKDYVVRAKEFKEKRRRLKKLKRIAAARNPDEFHFSMQNRRVDQATGESRSAVPTGREFSAEELRLMQTEDVSYLNMRRAIDLRKAEKLRSVLHAFDTPATSVHTLFVDEEGGGGGGGGEIETREKLAERLDTVPEAVFSKVKPRASQLRDEKLVVGGDPDAAVKGKKAREKRYAEILARKKRANRIAAIAREIEIKKLLSGKGRKWKLVDKETGAAQFIWRQERKR